VIGFDALLGNDAALLVELSNGVKFHCVLPFGS
jgi:hypothetical protein